MAFDRKRAEETIVDILDGPRVVGMGFRLFGDVIATACHCLPHAAGKVLLPDPDDASPAPLVVRVRLPGTATAAFAAVVAADPCSDHALLRSPPAGVELPDRTAAPLAELAAARAPAHVDPGTFAQGSVFVFTHEKRWVEGILSGSVVSIWKPADRIRAPTSGAPVFDRLGRVVALVGKADIRIPDAPVCMIADQLPAWALRGAREAEEAQARSRSPVATPTARS